MLLPKLFEALRPGTDADRMKGALYVLGSKVFGNFAILDWRFGPTYILSLLNCQHQPKPSVQALVKNIQNDYIVRLAEPSTIRSSVKSIAADTAATHLLALVHTPPNESLQTVVRQKAVERMQQKNAAYTELVSLSSVDLSHVF